MDVVLSPESEELVRQKVASGRYQNAGAVLEEALSVLDERDRIEGWRAALDLAEEEIARGEGILYTPEVFEDIKREVRQMIREGRKPESDVYP